LWNEIVLFLLGKERDWWDLIASSLEHPFLYKVKWPFTSSMWSQARRKDSLLFRNAGGGGLSTVLSVALIVLRTSFASSFAAASGFELKNAWYLKVSKINPSSLVGKKGPSAGRYYSEELKVRDSIDRPNMTYG
jgi:hypothetical protein